MFALKKYLLHLLFSQLLILRTSYYVQKIAFSQKALPGHFARKIAILAKYGFVFVHKTGKPAKAERLFWGLSWKNCLRNEDEKDLGFVLNCNGDN